MFYNVSTKLTTRLLILEIFQYSTYAPYFNNCTSVELKGTIRLKLHYDKGISRVLYD